MAEERISRNAERRANRTEGGANRRTFLKQMCTGAAAAAVGSTTAHGAEKAKGSQTGTMPTISLGEHTVTRLIAGSNPVAGYSHSTRNLARHMREFFTLERTIQFAKDCERVGINTWQTSCSNKIFTALRKLREQGSKLQWICLTSDNPMEPKLEEVLKLKPIGIVHHGGVTDMSFRLKRKEKVSDFIKKVKDAGVLAGVSAHNPENIAYVEEHGWENDFFMTCFYNVMRDRKEIRAKLGTVPLGEPFFESDRDEMTDVMKKVKKPCLGFKILAAGRLAWSEHSVESAFRYAFERIKKTDAVILGMYPKFEDEIAHNAQLTMKYGQLA